MSKKHEGTKVHEREDFEIVETWRIYGGVSDSMTIVSINPQSLASEPRSISIRVAEGYGQNVGHSAAAISVDINTALKIAKAIERIAVEARRRNLVDEIETKK